MVAPAGGDEWFFIAPDVLASFCAAAGLVVDHCAPWPGATPADAEDRALAWHLVIAHKPNAAALVQ